MIRTNFVSIIALNRAAVQTILSDENDGDLALGLVLRCHFKTGMRNETRLKLY